jgi:hypothetical protein
MNQDYINAYNTLQFALTQLLIDVATGARANEQLQLCEDAANALWAITPLQINVGATGTGPTGPTGPTP